MKEKVSTGNICWSKVYYVRSAKDLMNLKAADENVADRKWMASKYFVVLGGSASGIYDTFAEAKNKSGCSNHNHKSIEKSVEIVEYTSLADAFKCLQSFKSSQNKSSAINSNSQLPQDALDKSAFSVAVSAELQYVTKPSDDPSETKDVTENVFKKVPEQGKGVESSNVLQKYRAPIKVDTERLSIRGLTALVFLCWYL